MGNKLVLLLMSFRFLPMNTREKSTARNVHTSCELRCHE
jgi:hypothetical protein